MYYFVNEISYCPDRTLWFPIKKENVKYVTNSMQETLNPLYPTSLTNGDRSLFSPHLFFVQLTSSFGVVNFSMQEILLIISVYLI